MPLLTASIESRNGVARIALCGELDLATVPIVREHLGQCENDGVDAIMLDLRQVTFVDSSGLHAFLTARDHAHSNGHRFVLVGPSRATRRLFEMTGTQFLLDEEEAAGLLDRFTGSRASQGARAYTDGLGDG